LQKNKGAKKRPTCSAVYASVSRINKWLSSRILIPQSNLKQAYMAGTLKWMERKEEKHRGQAYTFEKHRGQAYTFDKLMPV
jgi:hypothetical protein